MRSQRLLEGDITYVIYGSAGDFYNLGRRLFGGATAWELKIKKEARFHLVKRELPIVFIVFLSA
jgi:hypothetical protein